MTWWPKVWFPPRGQRLKALIDWRWWVFRLIPFRIWIEIASALSIALDIALFGPVTDESEEAVTIRMMVWILTTFLFGMWVIWGLTDRFFERYQQTERSS